MKQPIRKVAIFIRDTIETYIPIVAFMGLFSVFVLQVFFRYVLRNPQPWASEVSGIFFLWTILLGACYAQRKKSHVMFTLIYDMLPLKLKALTAFLGNLLIAVAFIFSFVPTWNFVKFMAVQKTSLLKIGMNIVYFPYMIFMAMILIYTLIEMHDDFMVFTGLGSPEYIERMKEESKPEYQKIVEEASEGGGERE